MLGYNYILLLNIYNPIYVKEKYKVNINCTFYVFLKSIIYI